MPSQKFPVGSDTHYIINRVLNQYGVNKASRELYAVLLFLDAQFYAEYISSATGIQWARRDDGLSLPLVEITYDDTMDSDLAVCDAVLEELDWVLSGFTLDEIMFYVSSMAGKGSAYSAKTAYAFDDSLTGKEYAKAALEQEAENRWLTKELAVLRN